MACGFGRCGSSAADATTPYEKEYVGVPEVSSSMSAYPGSDEVNHGWATAEGEEEEEELHLGLSLGSRMDKTTVGNGRGMREAAWSERCRMLTAEDLPSMAMGSPVGVPSSPLSSSLSSVSSSSPEPPLGGNGEKRIPDNHPGMFLNTVRRIRIMRTSDTNGLVARFPSFPS